LVGAAEAVRNRLPGIKIIICADDDYLTDNNPGIKKAIEAAGTVSGYIAIPEFGNNRPDKATDFNDLHKAQGLNLVKACIEKSTSVNNLDVTSVTDVTANKQVGLSVNVTRKHRRYRRYKPDAG
tara:strand:- start:457 stop:828 length:372 start_codon:yes stop_codon:yes gene_type:complete